MDLVHQPIRRQQLQKRLLVWNLMTVKNIRIFYLSNLDSEDESDSKKGKKNDKGLEMKQNKVDSEEEGWDEFDVDVQKSSNPPVQTPKASTQSSKSLASKASKDSGWDEFDVDEEMSKEDTQKPKVQGTLEITHLVTV